MHPSSTTAAAAVVGKKTARSGLRKLTTTSHNTAAPTTTTTTTPTTTVPETLTITTNGQNGQNNQNIGQNDLVSAKKNKIQKNLSHINDYLSRSDDIPPPAGSSSKILEKHSKPHTHHPPNNQNNQNNENNITNDGNPSYFSKFFQNLDQTVMNFRQKTTIDQYSPHSSNQSTSLIRNLDNNNVKIGSKQYQEFCNDLENRQMLKSTLTGRKSVRIDPYSSPFEATGGKGMNTAGEGTILPHVGNGMGKLSSKNGPNRLKNGQNIGSNGRKSVLTQQRTNKNDKSIKKKVLKGKNSSINNDKKTIFANRFVDRVTIDIKKTLYHDHSPPSSSSSSTVHQEYYDYLKKTHPNMKISIENPNKNTLPSEYFKNQILYAKKVSKQIFSKGKKACLYLFGLVLLNELRLELQDTLRGYQTNNDSILDWTFLAVNDGNVNGDKRRNGLFSSLSSSLPFSPKHLSNTDYENHLNISLDVLMYIIHRVNNFIEKFEKIDFISLWFNYLINHTQTFTKEMHSTMFFWTDVTENAIEHAVSRTFLVVELLKGPTFLPQLTPADEHNPQGTNEPWIGSEDEDYEDCYDWDDEFDPKTEFEDGEDREYMSPGQQMLIQSLPTERVFLHHRWFRFPFLTPTIRIDEDLLWAPARQHYFWPITFARWFKEILYKIALPVIDCVEWLAWRPQIYIAQRVADVFFFFDAKVAYHTRNFVQDAILSRYNFPLIDQLALMRRGNHSSFDISLYLLTYIGAAARESYRIIEKNMPKLTESDVDLAIAELEIELRALQNSSQSEIELFAEHYRVYADNLPVYFNERLRPFLTRVSEQPYDPLYKYFVFTYDKPKSGVKPLQKNELLILDKVRTPAPLQRLLTRFRKRVVALRLPFGDWTEHNKALPQHFIQGFENSLSSGFSEMTKILLLTAFLSKFPPFQRFFYRQLTLSYENRYKLHTYLLSTFSSMSLITAFLSVFAMSCVFEVYSQMWGPKNFYSICYGSALAINIATQTINLTLARSLLAMNIHRPALLAPQNGIFPLITLFWAYTSKAFPDGDLRFFYFPVGTRVDAIVSGWLFLDILGFFIFTLIFNRRTGLPHLSNILGFMVGLWLYTYHCKKYNVKPGHDYRLITDESTLPHVNENIPDSLIFFNVFATPLSREYRMKRQMWLEQNDMRRLRYERNANWNADVQTNNMIETWNLLYRYSQNRDFTAVENNLNKLRQLRQEWRSNFGDEDIKREVELGIEDKNIPYLMHTARFAQRQLERLQHIVDQAWTAETGMITPKEWADLEYEQFRSKGPKHSMEHAENHLNYNRLFEGQRWAFTQKHFPDGDQDVMYEQYIPARPLLRSLDQWMEWAETRGAVHWTRKSWQIFSLQPQLYPRLTDRQKRWFHPQDEFYELDYRTLKGLKSKRYSVEFAKERLHSSMWGGPKPARYDKEGIMNRHEKQLYKFARDPRLREGMINAYGFKEMHHHPSLMWKQQERRRLAHKFNAFPNWRKDWSIAWSNRPKVHSRNDWFPRKSEWDVMDDFELEQPLYKHGELNPFINNLAGVRTEKLVKHVDPHRDVNNVEPEQWAGFERKLWSHIPFKQRPIKRFQMTRAFNMVRGEMDTQFDDPHRQIYSKQSRYRPKGSQRTAARRANMEDHIKGKVLETQQFWGVQKRNLNRWENTFDKRTNFLAKEEEMSYKVDWDWQPFAMPRPRF